MNTSRPVLRLRMAPSPHYLNLVIDRPDLEAGAVPDISRIPDGSKIMLEAEPALDESDPMTPGLRVGVELWEAGYTIDHFAERGIRVGMFYSPDRLKALGLLTTFEDNRTFIGRLAAYTHRLKAPPHDVATDNFTAANALRKTWGAGKYAQGSVNFVTTPSEIYRHCQSQPSNTNSDSLGRLAEQSSLLISVADGPSETALALAEMTRRAYNFSGVGLLARPEATGIKPPARRL